jgi:hypothetical protein
MDRDPRWGRTNVNRRMVYALRDGHLRRLVVEAVNLTRP